MSNGIPEFSRGAVRPFECLSGGWQLIKDHYWLFMGVSVVGVLLGSLAPLGILLGPCMCGIHYCLRREQHGKRIEFGMLFKGFDYFMPSWIATLIIMVPMIILMVPLYVGFFVLMFVTIPEQPKNAPPDPAALLPMFGAMGGLFLAFFAIAMLVHVVFFFAYPLIIDRGLDGVGAVKLSARAALANFWGVLGLTLLNGILSLLGILCCYVGALFFMPIGFAAVWVAYSRVFPEEFEFAEASPEYR
jgi:hypothetical protein